MAAQQTPPTSNGVPLSSHTPETATLADYNQEAYSEKPPMSTRKPIMQPMPPRVKRKSKDDSLLASLCALIVEHQVGLSINLIALLFLTHICFPPLRPWTRTFFELSYYNPSTGLYTQGWDDVPFVCFWVVVFMGLRAGIMEYILMPLASMGGITKKRSRVRFAEQAWLIVYYVPCWSLGMYIMYHSDFWFNLRNMWTEFPMRSMTGLVKWYYLIQFAFWLQQIVVVNIEERRKDYYHMFIHHIITCTLISTSYSYYQIKVGIVILCIMDFIDIILSLAKDLKYLGFGVICDVIFGIFIVAWFITRHVFYIMICYSTHVHLPQAVPFGCYNSATGERLSETDDKGVLKHLFQSFRDPEGPVCFNRRIQTGFLIFLWALQIVTIAWFFMILKIAWKVVRGQVADDIRSDDEGADEEQEEEELDTEEGAAFHINGIAHAPLEEEVGVDGLHFTRKNSPGVGVNVKGKRRTTNRSNSGRASGISIPGHGDHKELLGRIGCDKPT